MNIDIALVTWPNHPKRWQCFQETVHSLRKYLVASSHVFHWQCSSESMPDPKHQWFGDELREFCRVQAVALRFRGGKPGLGENMNAALRMGQSDFVLLVQDDRPLLKGLDLRPAVDFLACHPHVDMVRFAWPPGRVRLVQNPDGWRRFDLHGGWPYGDEPHLRRRSFMDRWGWYQENVRFGAAEGIMLHHLVRGGATIVAADDIYFGHSGAGVSSVIGDTRAQGANR